MNKSGNIEAIEKNEKIVRKTSGSRFQSGNKTFVNKNHLGIRFKKDNSITFPMLDEISVAND